jgi:tetratricopeptide (TPR) repeat protein
MLSWFTRVRLLGLLSSLLVLAGLYWFCFLNPSTPEALVQSGISAASRKDYATADTIVETLKSKQLLDHSHFLQGFILTQKQRWTEALQAFNRVEENEDVRFRAAVYSGRCLLELRNLREAFRVFRYVLDRDPDNILAHRGLAAVAIDLGNLGVASYELKEVIRLDDNDVRAWRTLGVVRGYQALEEDAIEAYLEALKRKPDTKTRIDILLELAERYLNARKAEDALATLDQRKALQFEELAALVLRADALFQLNRFDEATVIAQTAILDYPKSGSLRLVLGKAFLGLRQNEKAIAALEEAVRLQPNDFQTRYTLGRAYRLANRSDEATAQETKTAEIQKILDTLQDLTNKANEAPWDAQSRRRMGDLYTKLGNTKLAAMWYKAAAACEPQ